MCTSVKKKKSKHWGTKRRARVEVARRAQVFVLCRRCTLHDGDNLAHSNSRKGTSQLLVDKSLRDIGSGNPNENERELRPSQAAKARLAFEHCWVILDSSWLCLFCIICSMRQSGRRRSGDRKDRHEYDTKAAGEALPRTRAKRAYHNR